jgi:tetratricopeptide (TPR) repeat protein
VGLQHPRQRISEAGERLAIAKEVGDRAGEGNAYGNLGNAFESQGDFRQAIEYRTQHLAIAKEVGDRAGEGGVHGNQGNAYEPQGDFSQAIEYHGQHRRLQRRWATGRGRAMHTRTLGARISRRGTSAKPSSTTRSAWPLQRR